MNNNLPTGYREEQPNHYPKPKVNDENVNTVYKSLPWQKRINGTKEQFEALEASLKRSQELTK